jgi:hypothetical protein
MTVDDLMIVLEDNPSHWRVMAVLEGEPPVAFRVFGFGAGPDASDEGGTAWIIACITDEPAPEALPFDQPGEARQGG